MWCGLLLAAAARLLTDQVTHTGRGRRAASLRTSTLHSAGRPAVRRIAQTGTTGRHVCGSASLTRAQRTMKSPVILPPDALGQLLWRAAGGVEAGACRTLTPTSTGHAPPKVTRVPELSDCAITGDRTA